VVKLKRMVDAWPLGTTRRYILKSPVRTVNDLGRVFLGADKNGLPVPKPLWTMLCTMQRCMMRGICCALM
jgi:hypothetical protein